MSETLASAALFDAPAKLPGPSQEAAAYHEAAHAVAIGSGWR